MSGELASLALVCLPQAPNPKGLDRNLFLRRCPQNEIPTMTGMPRTEVRCPRTDSAPHFAHYWGDPDIPADDRWCPGDPTSRQDLADELDWWRYLATKFEPGAELPRPGTALLGLRLKCIEANDPDRPLPWQKP